MPHDPFQDAYTSPKTPGHVIKTIWALKENLRIIGDFADGVEGNIIVEGTAGATALTAGDIVYVSASGVFSRAQANAALTSEGIGIVVASVSAGAPVRVQVAGTIQITGWGLSATSWYYLSPSVAGGKTTTAPTTAGQYVVPIGRAITNERLALLITPGILL